MDVFGAALSDYYFKNSEKTLWLHNSYDDPEEMPIDIFFRTAEEMPDLELKALSLCKGNVLDVGAGVGSHALILQSQGLDVTAIDISETAVEIMKRRGVKNARVVDFFQVADQYDTLLFLMNGIGITGTLAGFTDFLKNAKRLLSPGGQLIFDSSDISYLYTDLQKPANTYFGEVSYCYEYEQRKGSWFNWLYLDQQTLQLTAKSNGWNCEIIYEDGEDQYLARLTTS